MKPRVSIVNGIARMKKYNTEQLGAHYNDMGYEVVEHKFPTHLLFCCHMHHKLEPIVENMVEGADIIHCQSSGFFPVLPHFVKHNIRKPLIMESPVLKSHTGTLLAATNKVRHFKDAEQNALINWALDTFAFTPTWTADTLDALSKKRAAGDVLVLHSEEDNVSDIRDLEEHFDHIWKKGRHARLFDPKTGNDFNVIKNFIENYKS